MKTIEEIATAIRTHQITTHVIEKALRFLAHAKSSTPDFIRMVAGIPLDVTLTHDDYLTLGIDQELSKYENSRPQTRKHRE